MTGPEHYQEAERLLSVAEGCDWQSPESSDREFARVCLDAAQAHATLAHAAAMALQVTATQAPHLTEAGADWRAVLKPAEQTCPGGC